MGIGLGAREDDYEASGVETSRAAGGWLDAALERHQGDLGRATRSAPRTSGSPGLVVGGHVDASFARAARFGDGWIAGGAPPEQFAEMAAKAKAAWAEAGREGEPRLMALAYYSLGERAEEEAKAYLMDYYALLGEEIAGYIVSSAAKDADTVRAVPGGVRGCRLRRADPLPLLQRSRSGRPARRRGRALAPGRGARMADDLPILLFASKQELEAWLEENHAGAEGLWLKIAKKGSGVESVNYAEALELALCFGWIDSQKRGFDEAFFLQRFTPRRPRGKWSQINRAKAEELIAAGAMRPAGLAEVEAAKADGRWEAAYAGQRAATVPDDLKHELDRNEAAREFFATLDSANRYAILYRLQEAKKPETRQKRLRKFVAMLERGEKIHG